VINTKLASQTQKTAGIPNGMRTATVASVSSAGVPTLSMNGGLFSSGVGCLKSYVPVAGDTVAVFRQDSSWLVLGSIAAGIVATRGQLTGTQLITFTSATAFTTTVNFGTDAAAASWSAVPVSWVATARS
jgi:hypothetical protein